MKKLFTLFLALVMIVSMAACGKTDTPDNGGDNAEKATYRVGVCQLAQHPALDAATQGFVDALKEELGDDVNIEVQNASGESNNCSTIINGFLSSDVDLIMANATPALTAAASATSEVPILGTAVTAYGVALDLDDFGGTVGGNISGTSDLADLEKQAAMVTEWFPDAKKVGLLFCSAEPNSRYQIDEITKHLTAKGITCTEFAFTNSNDLTAAGVPAVCGEAGLCAGCGVCTLSIDYYDLGVTTGKMAAKILKGEADISTMPIEYAPAAPKYNAAMCETMNITPLEGYTAIEG